MRTLSLTFFCLNAFFFSLAQADKHTMLDRSNTADIYSLIERVSDNEASIADLTDLSDFLDAKGLWIAPQSLAGSTLLGNEKLVNLSMDFQEFGSTLEEGILFNANDHDVFVQNEQKDEQFRLPSMGVLIVGGSFDFANGLSRVTMITGSARDGLEFQDLMTWKANSVRIRTQNDWKAFLSEDRRNSNGLLKNLSDRDIKMFEQRLVFGDVGVASLYVRILKTKCTFEQYNAILGLFGLSVEYSLRADYEDKECEKRATCSTRMGSICTSNC